jgi:hypothetical protein
MLCYFFTISIWINKNQTILKKFQHARLRISWNLILRATSHTRLRARDHYTSCTLIGGKGEAGPSSLHTRLRDQRSMWMWDGCKSTCMDSYMASNGSYFMVTWPIFKNHFLEVSLTQNRKTMAFQTLTIVDIFDFIIYVRAHMNRKTRKSIWFEGPSHMASHYTWGFVTTLHDFGGVLGRPLDTFFWGLTISWSRLLARVWSGPKTNKIWPSSTCPVSISDELLKKFKPRWWL